MVDPVGTVSLFGGREIHWRERVGERPLVVLMAGCGLAMEYWREVVEHLPGLDLVAYDRPGMGGTRWPGHLPSLAEEVATLVDLIGDRGGPAILVAHSMASFHAEALARAHPELVRAVVMIDGSCEWYTKPPRVLSSRVASVVSSLSMNLRLGWLGEYGWRTGAWMQSNREFARLSRGRLPSIYRDPNALAMAIAESMGYEQQAWDLMAYRDARGWPDIRTLILTADSSGGDGWIEQQARYADLLNARHIVVAQSRHLMMLDRPDVIADAIRSCR